MDESMGLDMSMSGSMAIAVAMSIRESMPVSMGMSPAAEQSSTMKGAPLAGMKPTGT